MTEWRTARLPDVAKIIMGQSPPGNTYNEVGEGLPFFQGKAEFGDTNPIAKKWCDAPKKIAEAGDILMSVRAPVGPINVAFAQSCIGRGLAAIRGNEAVVAPGFLRFFLRHKGPYLASIGQGSTFAAIGKTELASLELRLPPLEEQRRIVDILSRAEGIVRLRREAQKKADDLSPALFLDMFGNPGTNPKGWRVERLSKLCNVQTGATPLRNNPAYYAGYIPWVKTAEVARGDITHTEEHISELALSETNCKIFPIGTILVAMYGQGQTRGRSAMLKIEAASNQACAAILPSDKIMVEFLFFFLQTQYKQLRSLAHGGNQANLNLTMVKTYPVILPPKGLQDAFVRRVEHVRSIQCQQATATQKAEAAFEALLARTFNIQ